METDFVMLMTSKRLANFLAATTQTHEWVFDRLAEILSRKYSNILPA